MKFVHKFINNIKKIVNEILKDKVIKHLLIIGIISYLIVYPVTSILDLLKISMYTNFLPFRIYYLFILAFLTLYICISWLVIYLPFFKKSSTPKTKQVKILIFDWLFLSICILTFIAINQNTETIKGYFENIIPVFLVKIMPTLFLVGLPFLIVYWLIRNNLQRSKIITASITTAIISSLILVAITHFYFLNKKTTVEVYQNDIEDTTKITCYQTIGTKLYLQESYDTSKYKKADGKLFTNNREKISIKIEGKELTMLTNDFLKPVKTYPKKFIILINDKEQITAIYTQEDIPNDKGIETFLFNKKNGFGVWTKSRPNISHSNQTPDVQAYYLGCIDN